MHGMRKNLTRKVHVNCYYLLDRDNHHHPYLRDHNFTRFVTNITHGGSVTLVSLNEATNGRVPGQFHPIGRLSPLSSSSSSTPPSPSSQSMPSSSSLPSSPWKAKMEPKGEAPQMTPLAPNFKQPVPIPTVFQTLCLIWCCCCYHHHHIVIVIGTILLLLQNLTSAGWTGVQGCTRAEQASLLSRWERGLLNSSYFVLVWCQTVIMLVKTRLTAFRVIVKAIPSIDRPLASNQPAIYPTSQQRE